MKLPSREYIIANIKKNFWARLSLLSFVLAMWLMLDEKIKQGYFFHIKEVTNLFCHEFWVVVFLLIAVISFVIHKLRGDDKRG